MYKDMLDEEGWLASPELVEGAKRDGVVLITAKPY